MNVETIVVDPDYAIAKLREFRNVTVENRRVEDNAFRRLYRAASKGKPIIDVANAMKSTGLSEAGYPKLAFAKATWKNVAYDPYYVAFFDKERRGRWTKQNYIGISKNVYPSNSRIQRAFSPVPFIPPNLRPQDDLENYHILFEVLNWNVYPADPFLLKHIIGWLYIVIAEWELTELERSLLQSM